MLSELLPSLALYLERKDKIKKEEKSSKHFGESQSRRLRLSPVEVLAQFDALLRLQVAEATQEAGVGVEGHSEELQQAEIHVSLYR